LPSRIRPGRWRPPAHMSRSRPRSRRRPSSFPTLLARFANRRRLGVPLRGHWGTVATNLRLVPYTQDQVFAVLSDPERYAGWVVGATKTRTIDRAWPQPGSRFAHRQGAGPLH